MYCESSSVLKFIKMRNRYILTSYISKRYGTYRQFICCDSVNITMLKSLESFCSLFTVIQKNNFL